MSDALAERAQASVCEELAQSGIDRVARYSQISGKGQDGSVRVSVQGKKNSGVEGVDRVHTKQFVTFKS